MPTNRPFFANFLAAFRAHSALKASPSTSSSVTPAPPPTSTNTTTFTPPTLPRSIATKAASPSATAAAVQAANHLSHTRSPVSRSPPGYAKARRGSDSSSECGGFRDLGEKWFVGGRTASGEERFLRLGVVRKGSAGRLSLDRLSL